MPHVADYTDDLPRVFPIESESNTLTNHLATAEESAHERIIDECYSGCIGAIALEQRTTSQKLNTDRIEVTWSHGVDLRPLRLVTGCGRLTDDIKGGLLVLAAERSRRNHACTLHSGQASYLFQQTIGVGRHAFG